MAHDGGLGSEPIQEDLREKMNAIADALHQAFNGEERPGTVGFVLMTFNFGDCGRCNYISNARREDVVTLLKEQLAYFEGMPQTHPRTAQ